MLAKISSDMPVPLTKSLYKRMGGVAERSTPNGENSIPRPSGSYRAPFAGAKNENSNGASNMPATRTVYTAVSPASVRRDGNVLGLAAIL